MAEPENTDNQIVSDVERSLCGEFTQAAYERTFAEVMGNPERDGIEILEAAACANMDIIFGEDHSVMADTMKQIALLTESLPMGHVKAIALEMPVDMQEIFDPDTLRETDPDELIQRIFMIDIEFTESVIGQAHDIGDINGDQYDYLMDEMSDLRGKLQEIFKDPDMISGLRQTVPGQIYEMAKTALEHGTPVIAADVDRQREVAIMLNGNPGVPEHLRMSQSDFERLLNQGVDDRSDVELLKDFGVDLDGPGVLVAHRGYAHINGVGLGEQANIEQTNGIDDILERSGRSVLTIEIGLNYLPFGGGPDPADIVLQVNGAREVQLVRSAHQPEEEQSPSLPVDTNSMKPNF